VFKGLLAGGITTGIAAVFPEAVAFPFFAAVLGLFLGVYPGIAMVDPIESRPGIQWVVAVCLLILGLVGLWDSPILLAAAWLIFGCWALLHRLTGVGEGVPEGYPSFAFSYSLVAAGFVAYMSVVGG